MIQISSGLIEKKWICRAHDLIYNMPNNKFLLSKVDQLPLELHKSIVTDILKNSITKTRGSLQTAESRQLIKEQDGNRRLICQNLAFQYHLSSGWSLDEWEMIGNIE